MSQRIIEVCAGSYEDALAAYKGGATRVELNSALFMGGLTPTLASLKLTKQNTNLKVITMIRPRGAGFYYTDAEFEVMKLDTRIMMENGADGIAFGILDEHGEIDVVRNKEIIDIVKEYNGEVVFHRAYDCVNDPYASMETLIDLGVTRVLTSGLEEKAPQGMDMIKELQKRYGDKIEILAGGGMNASNALEMMEYTGISQVHSSCKEWIKDPTTYGAKVTYTYAPDPHISDYDIVSEDLVKLLVESIKER